MICLIYRSFLRRKRKILPLELSPQISFVWPFCLYLTESRTPLAVRIFLKDDHRSRTFQKQFVFQIYSSKQFNISEYISRISASMSKSVPIQLLMIFRRISFSSSFGTSSSALKHCKSNETEKGTNLASTDHKSHSNSRSDSFNRLFPPSFRLNFSQFLSNSDKKFFSSVFNRFLRRQF